MLGFGWLRACRHIALGGQVKGAGNPLDSRFRGNDGGENWEWRRENRPFQSNGNGRLRGSRERLSPLPSGFPLSWE